MEPIGKDFENPFQRGFNKVTTILELIPEFLIGWLIYVGSEHLQFEPNYFKVYEVDEEVF